jgi:hypothetical protein
LLFPVYAGMVAQISGHLMPKKITLLWHPPEISSRVTRSRQD